MRMGTELRHLVAASVEAARLHAGVSLGWLADRSGLPVETLDGLMREQADFTMVDLARIAEALDVAVTTLLPCSPAEDL